jgi:hypothetical protein
MREIEFFTVKRMMNLQRAILWLILATWITIAGIFGVLVYAAREIKLQNVQVRLAPAQGR